MNALRLQIHDWLPAVRDVLGPGLRAVVWVQGCSLHCPGCMVPETWPQTGGQWVSPEELAQAILQQPDIEGITISGGEPTEQAAAVARLLALVKAAGKNTWVYSGYTLEELLAREDTATDELLAFTDVLVDGRYDIRQAGSYRWRGSVNQRIICLSNAIPPERIDGGKWRQIEVRLGHRGQLILIGIPPQGFLRRFHQALRARGLLVSER